MEGVVNVRMPTAVYGQPPPEPFDYQASPHRPAETQVFYSLHDPDWAEFENAGARLSVRRTAVGGTAAGPEWIDPRRNIPRSRPASGAYGRGSEFTDA